MATSQSNRFIQQFQQKNINRKLVYSILIFAALFFFEIFNFSTTHFALRDLLGELSFLGIKWAVALSIAFCAIDFAGIARLFTPETGADEPKEVWYLFGAWLLAATMNAALTWWGVSMALVNHTVASVAIVDAQTILRIVPIFVAILVWVIRVLVIGTLSSTEESLFPAIQPTTNRTNTFQNSRAANPRPSFNKTPSSSNRNGQLQRSPMTARPGRSSTGSGAHFSPKAAPRRASIEPTYHSINGKSESFDFAENTPKPESKSKINSSGRMFY